MSVANPAPAHTLHRWWVPLAIVSAITAIALWFPFSTLMHQGSELNTVQSQINLLHSQQSALKSQERALKSKSAESRLARQEYQLVAPGQSLLQILPSNTKGGLSASSGDPGFAPLVSPLNSTSLAPTSSTTKPVVAKVHSGGLWSRVLRTLEFWH
jgi:hypothetical protein